MAKRSREPDEAIGPAVDGLNIPIIPPAPEPEPEPESEPDAVSEDNVVEHPVALICGGGPIAETTATLAGECGFIVEYVIREEEGSGDEQDFRLRLQDFDNFVQDLGIDRNFFVCIFLENIEDCESIMYQCLESQASYIGLFAEAEKRARIFENLRASGVPDAELATVHCPIGLNIGASTPEQLAVGITAELLACKNGTMKKLLGN